ncbi:MAG: glycosyltransferase [Planctomycetota bacterium]
MATARLSDYVRIVGEEPIEELRRLAAPLQGMRIQHINSTRVGGGVAEILDRLVPLSRELGLDAVWDVIEGDQRFFQVTKAFHNALQGKAADLVPEDFEAYLATNRRNAERVALDGDMVFVHDPQPAALVTYARRPRPGARLVWRCHIDISRPQERVWRFLERFVSRFHAAILSAPQFGRPLGIPQYLVPPSIDPLADKNRELSPEEVMAVLDRFGIDRRRPIVTQISRFDRFKDPVGVIRAFRMVRRRVNCQLVLAGGGATDDPEGAEVLAEVQEAAGSHPDVRILALETRSDVEVNALQRASQVVVQNSTKEGFGLTVSEALWKERPVVAGATGGIPLQVIDGFDGYLIHSPEGAAHAIRYLLQNPAEAERMGHNGRSHVQRNFLLTRQLRNELLVIHSMLAPDQPEVVLEAALEGGAHVDA